MQNTATRRGFLWMVLLGMCQVASAQAQEAPAAPVASKISLKTPQLVEGGGDKGVVRAIQQRVVYPQSALRRGIQGQCLVRFVVAPDGEVRGVKIMRSLDAAMDSAVVKAVRKLPRLEPATQFGKAVACPETAPVVFTISNPKRPKKAAPAADSTQFHAAVTSMPFYQGQSGFEGVARDLVAEYLRLKTEQDCALPTLGMGVLLTIGPSGSLYDVQLASNDEEGYDALVAAYGDAVVQREEPDFSEACMALLERAARNMPRLVPAQVDGKRVAMQVQLKLAGTRPD
jgi:TonB family protein